MVLRLSQSLLPVWVPQAGQRLVSRACTRASTPRFQHTYLKSSLALGIHIKLGSMDCFTITSSYKAAVPNQSHHRHRCRNIHISSQHQHCIPQPPASLSGTALGRILRQRSERTTLTSPSLALSAPRGINAHLWEQEGAHLSLASWTGDIRSHWLSCCCGEDSWEKHWIMYSCCSEHALTWHLRIAQPSVQRVQLYTFGPPPYQHSLLLLATRLNSVLVSG